LNTVCTQGSNTLDILFSDDTLVVSNKPSGLLSVPGRGPDKQDCMIARVQARFADALTVHRLDMETSGILLFARGAAMQRALSVAFQERQTEKRYIALVDGELAAPEGEIDLPLIADWPKRPRQMVDHSIGKPSLTRYRVEQFDPQRQLSRVALAPVTGRSHQLRVHMMSIGHAILGDALYASEAVRARAPRLMLHACKLEFSHPLSAEWLSFESPAPF
jgi:tRNA pseudouridine32 synthase / 23S rRNA pseudouridine746 synthase